MEETSPIANLGPEYKHFVGIRFRGSDKSYYFASPYEDLKIGDLVVVTTANGYEIGIVCTSNMPLSAYHGNLEFKPLLRKPNKGDMDNYNYNIGAEKRALEVCESYIKRLGLPMDLIDAVYTLDGEKVTITYTSTEKRVDFRELLHMLVPELSCRVELRQIASRDRAKMIGGIGLCGLPLCCSTFLTSFEGVSITHAKNQMLTLNIPKLSGPCGKLMCCLLFEDEAYTEAKKEFPRLGSIIHTPDGDYSVNDFNILSRTVRLVNATRDDWKTYPLEDIIAMQKGTYVKREEPLAKEDAALPSFGLHDASYGGLHPDAQDKGPYTEGPKGGQKQGQQGQGHGRNRDRGQRHSGNGQGGQGQQRQGQQRQNGQGQGNASQQGNSQKQGQGRRHHSHGHRHGGNGQGGQSQGNKQ